MITIQHQDKQYTGDGSDNYGNAARKTAEAVKQIGQSAAQKTAAAGAEATANAAAGAVQAGLEGGKAVAEIASGTAAGGPVGAVLAAAWASRHTLFKVLVSVCLLLLFIIILVTSLPTIVFNGGASSATSGQSSIVSLYDEMSAAVSACVTSGYEAGKAAAERIIADGGYDRGLSLDALIDYGKVSADYDVCYILAAYSVSIGQKGASKADLVSKLNTVATQMFAVTYEVKEATITISPTKAGETATSAIIEYAECTIHPFDSSVILTAFGIAPDASYGEFKIRTGDAIDRIATALKQTLYGAAGRNSVPAITDAELIAFLANLNCSPARKELIRVALSLVGKVPYFWGGKSAPGWNDDWNRPKLVTSAGSSSTGTLRPYGLDCSGFTDWVYKTALGKSLYDNGTWSQWDNSTAITEAELLPGDLGFLDKPGAVDVNHVLIYAGKDNAGTAMWVHCSSGAGGVALNSPTYVKYYRRVSGIELETQMVQSGTGAFSAQEVEWLAALVYYEARGMDSYCRELTAQVVINRIRSPKFPNTMKSVLMAPNQYGYGVSGATATLIFDGSYAGIMGTASWNACLKAAKKATSGTSVDEDGNAWPANVLFQHSFENPNANGSGLFKTYRVGGYWMHFNYG